MLSARNPRAPRWPKEALRPLHEVCLCNTQSAKASRAGAAARTGAIRPTAMTNTWQCRTRDPRTVVVGKAAHFADDSKVPCKEQHGRCGDAWRTKNCEEPLIKHK